MKSLLLVFAMMLSLLGFGQEKQTDLTDEIYRRFKIDFNQDILSQYSTEEELESWMSKLTDYEHTLYDEIYALEYKQKMNKITDQEKTLLERKQTQVMMIKKYHSRVKDVQNKLSESRK